jgi:hypothetical protein
LEVLGEPPQALFLGGCGCQSKSGQLQETRTVCANYHGPLAESVELPPPLTLLSLWKVLLTEEHYKPVPRQLSLLLSSNHPPPPVGYTLQLIRGEGHVALYKGMECVEDLLYLLQPVLCLRWALLPLERRGFSFRN